MRKIGEFQNIKDHGKPDRQQAQLGRPYQRIYENLRNIHLFIQQAVNHHQIARLAAKTKHNIAEEINYDPTDHKNVGGVFYSSFESYPH